jgi:uncharacterized membrane protein YsdA (DUF1294 family)
MGGLPSAFGRTSRRRSTAPGAFLKRHLFRHKTRKEPFSTYLQVILVLQIGVIIGWCVL